MNGAKEMKKIITSTILVIALLLTVLAVGSCAKTPDYQIAVNESNGVTITDDGMTVEAGDTVTIPQGEVYDKEGNYCPEFEVSRVITDDNGNRKAGTLQMKHGEVYTVTYTATNGEVTLEKVMKLYGYDTILPTLTLLNFQKAYAKGDTIQIKVKDISSDVDYDKSTIVLKNVTTNTTTDLSFTESYSFKAETESEQYKVIAELTDKNGNKQTVEYGFTIIGNFKDTNIDKNDIWDFDEIGYSNNVNVSGESDDLEYSIVTSDLPEDTNNMGIGSGALKLLLKAGETYTFTLTNGNGVLVENAGTIGFKLWTSEIIDIFEVYNVDNGTMYDLSWKAAKRNAWQKVEFDPLGTFAYDYTIESIKIKIGCEQDVTVYIDTVYYTDYEEGWIDEDLPEGILAEFDDERYLERITEALNIDSTTFGGSWMIVDSIPGTTDFNGAIKLVSTWDATSTSDKNARDGFKFRLFEKISFEDIDGFVFRVYCEDPMSTLTINFVDQKLGTSAAKWVSIKGATKQWANIIVKKEDLVDIIGSFKNITELNIRFIRPASNIVEGQEEYVAYLDTISLYSCDYDKMDYTFATEYDTNAAEGIGYATPSRVQDTLAKDGYALFTKTQLMRDSLSGVRVNFNHLDLSKYSNIYIRIRTTPAAYNGQNTVSFEANGNYLMFAGYSDYTDVDILPKLLENGEKYLDYIEIGRKSLDGVGIYIDNIEFVKLEDRPVYNDFTISASELKNNAGYTGFKTFEGGSLINLKDIKLGSYQGRNNILSFTSVAAKDNEGNDCTYSGGGVYIDFSKYVTGGKIIVSQKFTVTISVYMPTAQGHRIGVVYGSGVTSWKNVWKNPYGDSAGWKTITLTSDELHALEGCSDKEITGIYLGINAPNYTCAIESVKVTFEK